MPVVMPRDPCLTGLHAYLEGPAALIITLFATYAVHTAAGAIVLGAIATGVSTQVAIIVGGIVLSLAAPLLLVRPMPTSEPGAGADLHRGADRP